MPGAFSSTILASGAPATHVQSESVIVFGDMAASANIDRAMRAAASGARPRGGPVANMCAEKRLSGYEPTLGKLLHARNSRPQPPCLIYKGSSVSSSFVGDVIHGDEHDGGCGRCDGPR